MRSTGTPSPERWKRIDELFSQVLELSPEERKTFLKNACGKDNDLYNEVLSLVDSFDTGGPLDGIEKKLMQPLLSLMNNDPVRGRRIGNYRILRMLGYGGMGTVYLAERDAGDVEQLVALKVLRHGGHSDAMRFRFMRERQILARLEHPNIARFLDAGMADPLLGEPGHQPFLVMEYVVGDSITEHCDSNNLTITERLRLFSVVCRAVHFAHQRLIVHRDLKPSNIMVTEEGFVKLLDFGVAKLLAEDEELETLTDHNVLTPEYAAPEQVLGEPITTATDVYSLGVILYQLLTGDRPYEMKVRSAKEIERVICEVEPAEPSSIVRKVRHHKYPGGETRSIIPEEVSRKRNRTPEQLQRQLAGDLDVIVLKALAKDPGRRYASAEALLDDINKHLSGKPVLARKDTVGYRMGKFVGRHRSMVGVLFILFASLCAGLAGTTWQANRATNQAKIASEEAEKARQVTRLVAGLFEQSDPSVSLGDTLTVYDLLEDGTRSVEQDLINQPDIQAVLFGVLGRAYLNMGNYEPAGRLLTKAMALRSDASAENQLESLIDLGAYHEAISQHAEADSVFKKALQLIHQVPAERVDLVGDLYAERGLLFVNGGQWDSAYVYLMEALEIRRKLYGQNHQAVAQTLTTLASVATSKANSSASDSLNLLALDIQRNVLGERHPDVATTLFSLAKNKLYNKSYNEAIDYASEARAIFEHVYGDVHLKVVNTAMILAMAYNYSGEYALSDSAFIQVLEAQRALYEGDHVNISHTLHNFALLLGERGKLDDGVKYIMEAMAMRDRLFGPEHFFRLQSLRALGLIYMHGKAFREAEQVFEEALALGEKLYDEQNRLLTSVQTEYALVF